MTITQKLESQACLATLRVLLRRKVLNSLEKRLLEEREKRIEALDADINKHFLRMGAVGITSCGLWIVMERLYMLYEQGLMASGDYTNGGDYKKIGLAAFLTAIGAGYNYLYRQHKKSFG